MHKVYLVAGVMVLTASIVAPAVAGELGKKDVSRHEQQLEAQAIDTNEACGSRIQTAIDWKSFEKHPDAGRFSISSFCAAPLKALEELCEGERSRAYIQRNVRKMTCSSGAAGGGWQMRTRGKHVHWVVDFDAGNGQSQARAHLLREL